MPINVGIATMSTVTQGELTTFVREAGGEFWTDHPSMGHVTRGETTIWVTLAPENLAELLRDDGESLLGKSKDTPQSLIDIVISHAAGSDKLMLEFAVAFMSKWHSVLIDYSGGYYLLDEIEAFMESGRPLHTLFEFSPQKR